MLHVWMAARIAEGRITPTRIRLQLEPFDRPWPGWQLRHGQMSDDEYRRLCETTDEVEAERIHQELWLRLEPIEEA